MDRPAVFEAVVQGRRRNSHWRIVVGLVLIGAAAACIITLNSSSPSSRKSELLEATAQRPARTQTLANAKTKGEDAHALAASIIDSANSALKSNTVWKNRGGNKEDNVLDHSDKRYVAADEPGRYYLGGKNIVWKEDAGAAGPFVSTDNDNGAQNSDEGFRINTHDDDYFHDSDSDPCPRGTYGPNPANCKICPEGSYCPGGLSANECPPGSWSKKNAEKEKDCYCDKGFSGTGGDCNRCPAGSYCPGGADKGSKSIKCQAGSSSPEGSDDVEDCTCNPGRYGPDCTVCAEGFFCPGGADKQACPDGSMSQAKASSIYGCMCAAGTFASNDKPFVCTKCPADSICTGNNGKQGCPPGMQAPEGSKKPADCKPAPPAAPK